jgi:hypothetical protein
MGSTVRTLYLLLPSHANVPLDQKFSYPKLSYSWSLLPPFLASPSHSARFILPHDDSPAKAAREPLNRVRLRGYDARLIVGASTGSGRATVTSGWTRMGDTDAGVLLSKRAATRARALPLHARPHPRWLGPARRARRPTPRRRRRRKTRQYSRSRQCASRHRGPALRLDPRRRVVKAFRAATGTDAGERTERRGDSRRWRNGETLAEAPGARGVRRARIWTVCSSCKYMSSGTAHTSLEPV